MKSSVSPRILLPLALAMVVLAGSARAQDVLILKDNTRREGQIMGLAGDQVKIKIGPVETSVALAQVASVVKEPPKAFDDIVATWQTGDATKTLAVLVPFVQSYRGLPTPWAERASALLGEVYLANNQIPNAETAFADFQKAYPSSTLVTVGLARLAVAKKDYETAKTRLQPILVEAEKVTIPPTGKSATYGQAYYLMGLINENDGKYAEALKDYLSTVTLFYEDKAVAAKAQDRANILIKDKQVIVP